MKCIYLILLFIITSCATQLKTVSLMKGHKRSQHEAYAKKVMIATQGSHATQAGLKMIELGGNAFDAAAAVSFAISVERPQSTGLGGGGFMILDGPKIKSPIALDFREKAPFKGHSKMFLNKKGEPVNHLPIDGILASGVPGLVKGVVEMHKKYGKLSLKTVIKPAINLAEKGFKIYPYLAKAIDYRKNILGKYEASKKIFFKNGKPLKEGDWLIQKDLGKTLRAIDVIAPITSPPNVK